MPTEAGRHRLYETVKHAWGEDNADELMSLLPPVGWGDVATKQDLAHLEARLDAKFDAKIAKLDVKFAELDGSLKAGLSGLRAEMQAGFRRQASWTVGAMVGLTAIFSAVVTIAR